MCTGWLRETVNCNFSLTDLKSAKNGLPQWFSSRKFREVLIFWCLKRARWKKKTVFQGCAKVVCFPAWLSQSALEGRVLTFFYKRCQPCYTSPQFGWPKPSSNECNQYLWFLGPPGYTWAASIIFFMISSCAVRCPLIISQLSFLCFDISSVHSFVWSATIPIILVSAAAWCYM